MLHSMTRAYLALGSNLGTRQAALRAALDRLNAIPGTQVTVATPGVTARSTLAGAST